MPKFKLPIGRNRSNVTTMDNQDAGLHRRKRKRKLNVRHVLLMLLMAFVVFLIVSAGVVFCIAATLPDVNSESILSMRSSIIYDTDEKEIAALNGGENRVDISLDEMPQHLKDAFISTEDVRFYGHNGVDIIAIFRAAFADLRSGSYTQGASTITMQLVSTTILNDTEKTMLNKLKEAVLAIKVEQKFDKDEILNYYLNEIYLAPGTYGVEAASQYYFDKPAKDLTLSEAAMLAGIVRSPGYYSPYNHPERALQIRNTVLDNLIKYDEDTYGEIAKEAQDEELDVSSSESQSASLGYEYGWFVDYVIEEASDILSDLDMSTASIYSGGYNIYSTMDTDVQTAMEEVYNDSSNFPESPSNDIVESAMAVMDPYTGEVRGVVGGRVYETKRGFNRSIDLTRQPGSTIKPIVVYGPAVDQGYYPGTVLLDTPTTFGVSYSPTNYDSTWRGRISMRTAIMKSVNMAAVKMLQEITPETGWEYGVKMGLPLVADDTNLALALGGLTNGVSPVDMAGAYSTFANSGNYIEPHCITKITDADGNVIYDASYDETKVFSKQTAYIMTDMLQSVTTGGTGKNAKMNRPVASKTGTTQLPDLKEFEGKGGYKDAWFAAYTPELVGVVWMGYDNTKDEDGNAQYLRLSWGGGGSYPAKIWKKVMTASLSDTPAGTFDEPSGITTVTIDTKSGLLPSSLTPDEYIGTEICNEDDIVTESSDIWKTVEICVDSKGLATEYCPNTTKEVRIIREKGISLKGVADAGLYAPASCTLHTTVQEGLIKVSICTDPRHGSTLVLANIAGNGDSGGCPDEYVATRYYAPESVPTAYCSLSDHAITYKSGSTNNGSKPKSPSNISAVYTTEGCYISWYAENDASTTIYVVERTDSSGNKTKFSVYDYAYIDDSVVSGQSYKYRVYCL